MNPRQQRFLEAYATPGSPTFGNGTASAKAAGYKGTRGALAVTAHEVLKRARTREQILAAPAMSPSEVMAYLADMVRDQEVPARDRAYAAHVLSRCMGLQSSTLKVEDLDAAIEAKLRQLAELRAGQESSDPDKVH